MASRTLFPSPPTHTLCLQPDYRKSDPFSRYVTQNLGSVHYLQSPWLGITTLSFQSSKTGLFLPKTRPISATVTLLPISKPERFTSAENIPKWSQKAVSGFSLSEAEARRRGYITIGPECILTGLSLDGTNKASKVLRANGIMLDKVREETIKLVGGRSSKPKPRKLPLTESAQRALDWAVDEKLKSGGDEAITTCHLLLGVWAEEESVGHKILANLGFNDEKAKELRSVISRPGFVEE